MSSRRVSWAAPVRTNFSAITGPNGSHQCIGVLVYLLPYMEAQPVFDRLTQTLRVGVDTYDDNYWKDANAWAVAQTTMGAFLCPSLPNTFPDCGMIGHTWGEYNGSKFQHLFSGWIPSKGPLGVTHYQAVAGIYGKIGSQWRIDHFGNSVVNDRYLIGVYTARSKISTEHITDGTSKMLAFGEAPGSIGHGIEPYPGCTGEYPVGIRLDWHSRAGNELWPGRVARERSPQSRRFVPNASILLRQSAPGRHGAVRTCGWIGTRSPEKCRFGRLSCAVNNRRRRDR